VVLADFEMRGGKRAEWLGCGWIIKNPGRWLVERSGVGRWGAAGVVCGLVAWLWPRGSACVVRLVVCLRLRACVRVRARERGDEIFTAWVRRKPVAVTARGRLVLPFGRVSRAASETVWSCFLPNGVK
jgi:hypothetical protein